MQHTTVISSNLASVGYDHESETLEVTFRSRRTYAYSDVPESVYQGLMNAHSKGSYFAAHIKDYYATRRL